MNTVSSVSRRCLVFLPVLLLCISSLPILAQGQNFQQAQAEFQQNAQPLVDAAKSARELANADVILYRNALTAAYTAQTADQIDINDLNKKSAALKSDIAAFHDRLTQIQELATDIRAKYNIDSDTHLATPEQVNAAISANNDIGSLQQMSDKLDNTLSSVLQHRSTLPGGELTAAQTGTTSTSGTTTQTTTTTTTVSQSGTTYTSPVYVDSGPDVTIGFGFSYGSYYPWYNPWYYPPPPPPPPPPRPPGPHPGPPGPHPPHPGPGPGPGPGPRPPHPGPGPGPNPGPSPTPNPAPRPTPNPQPPHQQRPSTPRQPSFNPQPAPRPMPRPMPSHFGGGGGGRGGGGGFRR